MFKRQLTRFATSKIDLIRFDLNTLPHAFDGI